jgi:16S rRNA C967 or C1407 C5-methylase (RsmB/RsmF family)/NOL1/NOP2/fmu family ribosome biogenesis protein
MVIFKKQGFKSVAHQPVNHHSAMYALPEKLIASLRKLDHFDESAFREVHASGRQVVSVRFNPAKMQLKAGCWPAPFPEAAFQPGDPVPWSGEGYYLSERPSFTLDPFFHAGVYYVQEASGMFLEQALRNSVDLSEPVKVLDLCAAPGGKSTVIQSLISRDSLLISNEVIRTRVPVLHQQLDKWGSFNGIISNNDPKHFGQLPGFFDVLVVDAPCSGSGLFRRDPGAIREWSADAVALCRQRQQRILADAWECLKENGILIYSTCSYSPEENEEIVDHLMDRYAAEPVRIPIDKSWNIIETETVNSGYGYRFYPDKLKGEGFFLAVLRKKDGKEWSQRLKEKREAPTKKEESYLRKLLPDENLQFLRIGEWTHAMPLNLLPDLLLLKNYLYLKKAGVMAGKMGSDEWIPDHELALSTGLNPQIPELELSGSEALKYLRREVFSTDAQMKGWRPVSYRQQKLGWVKILSNRINNYFPKSSRILK